MLGTRMKRTAATAAIACSLFAGMSAAPASASASAATGIEAKFLSALKTEWNKSSAATQKTTCQGYKIDGAQVIKLSTAQLWATPSVRNILTKPGLKRVITKYLNWACSGPNTTPR
jgi:hypothetical protein